MTANDLFAAERVIADLTRDKQKLKAELEAEKLVNVKLPDAPRNHWRTATVILGGALLGCLFTAHFAARYATQRFRDDADRNQIQEVDIIHLRWKNRELAKIIHDDQNLIRALNEELLNARKK